MENQIDFTKPIKYEDGMVILPTIEFTEDNWNTVYRGKCISSTFYSYLVDGIGYGRFWIPKCYVRLAKPL